MFKEFEGRISVPCCSAFPVLEAIRKSLQTSLATLHSDVVAEQMDKNEKNIPSSEGQMQRSYYNSTPDRITQA